MKNLFKKKLFLNVLVFIDLFHHYLFYQVVFCAGVDCKMNSRPGKT